MDKTSIYDRIEKIIEEQGHIPQDFILEEDMEADIIRFVPGALEGILGHHTGGRGGDVEALSTFLKAHEGEDPEQVLECYEKEWADSRTAVIRDGILREIRDNKEQYDGSWLAQLAYCLMTEGKKTETVKLGLTLMALFNIWENAQVRKVMILLGGCEDFTEYVLYNLTYWPKEAQNQVCFALAKSLRGWGKINAVERLQADTEEIREWILCHGCRNTVMYSYLGLECAKKCNYLERLREGGLCGEELEGASDIMDGLLEEGPCRGISALEHGEETIYYYLCESRKRQKNTEYLCQLLHIREHLEKDCFMRESSESGEKQRAGRGEKAETGSVNWKERAKKELAEILASMDVKAVILQDLERVPYHAVSAARGFDVDIADVLFSLAEKAFTTYYDFGYYFMERSDCAERFVELCEKNLDVSRIPSGMGNSLFPGGDHWPVDMTVQYLDRYPGLGRELIRVCLRSPAVRWRGMAAKALEGWKEKGSDKWQELYGEIEEIAPEECNEALRERWQRLLSTNV